MLENLSHLERAEAALLLSALAEDYSHFNEFFELNSRKDIADLQQQLGLTREKIEKAVEHLAEDGLAVVDAIGTAIHVSITPRGYNTWALWNGEPLRFLKNTPKQG